jgi:hypothetical protein
LIKKGRATGYPIIPTTIDRKKRTDEKAITDCNTTRATTANTAMMVADNNIVAILPLSVAQSRYESKYVHIVNAAKINSETDAPRAPKARINTTLSPMFIRPKIIDMIRIRTVFNAE